MATFDDWRRLSLALPESVMKPAWGVEGYRVRDKLFTRLVHGAEDEAAWVKVGPGEREMLIASDPGVFFFTEHYRNHPAMACVRIAAVATDELEELLTDSWRSVAPKRLVAAFDADHPTPDH